MRSEATFRSSTKTAVVFTAFALLSIGCATWAARDMSTNLGAWQPLGKFEDATAAREAEASAGCLTCHEGIDSKNMHGLNVWQIGCADCHGGDPKVAWTGGSAQRPYSTAYVQAMKAAHVQPAFPAEWQGSRNPERTYALLNREKLEYVRFINPGDLRVAPQTCGTTGCHPDITGRVMTSMMTHSAMVMGSGTYNNGVLPYKNYVIGEFYMPNGEAALAKTVPAPTAAEKARGVVEQLIPVPRYNASQPGNIFRAAERGVANTRGLGTENRVDFAHFVLHKTRLNDPYVWFLGTNDYGAEFRSSGCSACHVLYANSEDPKMSAHIATHGYKGKTAATNGDPTIPKDEPGHPIEHKFTTRIPTSQCMSCHNHQGSGAIDNYAGLMWWDGESDGKLLYDEDGHAKKGDALHDVHLEANKQAKHTQFSSQHRSGWSFRKVYKVNVEGQMIDKKGNLIPWDDPDWASKAVHLADHHYEVGMQCIDCHTEQDVHGDGKLYGEMINPVEIYCTDCHGSVAQRSKLVTSNPAGGNDLSKAKAAGSKGTRQFRWVDASGNEVTGRAPQKGDVLKQRSKVDPSLEWSVPQIVDVIDPSAKNYNSKARIAKTLQKGNDTYGDATMSPDHFAHSADRMTCYTCHTSWAISCAGCHLAGKTNRNAPSSHFYGEKTLVDVGYYSQGLRSDCLMLGINGTVKGNKISPIRSASAPIATAENGNRAIVTHQQPTVSASGHSGHAFSPYIPHTVSAEHGQQCTSCHVSEADDNNSSLATRFNLGVHASDFVGAYVHLGTSKSVTAVRVTDGWEPQPVIGSDFHAMTFPKEHAAHVAAGSRLTETHTHDTPAVFVQARGEYLFTAAGKGGFRVLDIANIANKDVAQRIISAPFSPIGHDAHVATRDAAAVLLPTTVPMDPVRKVDPANEEQPVHPLFGYAYVIDRQEGLVVVDVNTFVDGDPNNNFVKRAATWNPDGVLKGGHGGMVVGSYLYVLVPDGIVVVGIDKPTEPRLVTTLKGLSGPRGIDVQFRYAVVTDAEGMKVIDITDLEKPALVPGAIVPLADARGVRLCRTYAYVAAGKDGLAIVDMLRFTQPKLVEKFTADGVIDDATAVTTGLTNASMFAYVADGKNGLRVVELWTPSRSHGTYGFSPKPTPRLVASRQTDGPAISISTGMIRDRGVDESGNQIGVFGRIGSRPFNKKEREAFYLRDGKVYRVNDAATGYKEAK